MKRIRLSFVPCLCILSLASGCRLFKNYKTITAKPEEFYSNTLYTSDTSLLSLAVAVDYKSIEAKINSMFSEPYSDEGSDEFDKQYQAKTKNPAYNPNKWSKTKDPLYHPNKWIKTKILGATVKTKDPFYHPNEWITTKNPAYNPNKWMYGNTVRLQVGYTYNYTITKRKDIKFVNSGNNTLRIIVPMDIDGAVGFKGAAAKLFSLTRKNIEGKIDFYIDTDISFGPNWCPKVLTNIDHKWVSDPKIEISDGVWLNLKLPVDLGLNSKEKEIEKDIATQIDCNKIRARIQQWVTPTSTAIEGFSDKLFLNISPKEFYLSSLYVDESTLNLQFGSKVLMNINTVEEHVAPQVPKIPELKRYTFDNNLIALTVPVKVQYDALNGTLNNYITSDSLNFESNGVNLKIKSFDVYPSGDALTIGVDIVAKFPNKLFSTKGVVYLTAKPVITQDRYFELQDFAFSTELDNKLYPVLGALFMEKITKVIHLKTKKDLKPKIAKAEALMESKVAEKLKEVNRIDVKTDKVVFDVPMIHVAKEELIIPVRLATGVKVKVIETWR